MMFHNGHGGGASWAWADVLHITTDANLVLVTLAKAGVSETIRLTFSTAEDARRTAQHLSSQWSDYKAAIHAAPQP